MQNVGMLDRSLRLVLAIGFTYLGLLPLSGSDLGNLSLIVAVVMGASGVLGTCFLYRLFGIDTRDRGAS